MPAENPAKRPLTQLNREIEAEESEATRLENERRVVAKEVRRASQLVLYFTYAEKIRKPTASFAMWHLAVLVAGPLVIGFLALVFVHLPTGSSALAFFAFLLGTLTGAGVLAALLYYPADALLPAARAEAEAQSRLQNARLQEKLGRIAEVKDRLGRLMDERRDQIASGKLQRAALLQRNWKSMRGGEWEDYVVEVLRTHGAAVERTGRIAGEDATLVADFGPRRVAVFTEGEGHNVASSTIQQAIAARERHRCQTCAVIINRRFTGAAQDFAKRNGCTTVGSGEFPDFVLGKIEL
jgi:hypothetical protein